MQRRHPILTILFFFGAVSLLCAQQPQPASSTRRALNSPVDTTPVQYAFALTPERPQAETDTLPDYQFRMYDPARRQMIDWAHLGNLGSAARPMLYEPVLRKGFDAGVHAFDLYQLQAGDLRFFRHTRSFSEVYFSQGRTQFDGMVGAKFGRTFQKGANFSLDYRAINNLGQFRYQRDKHNALAMGLWAPVGKRYDFFLIFTKNVIRQQENGGIATDTLFGKADFSGPIAAPVRLPEQEALSRHDAQQFFFAQHLKFTGNTGRAFRAGHTLMWQSRNYKFSDPVLEEDSSFFKDFLVDLRGIRNYLEYRQLDNAFTLSTYKAKADGRTADFFSAGISHSYFDLNQEPRNSTFSNWFLNGELALNPAPRFQFRAEGSLGLFENIGEYRLQARLLIELGKAGLFRASLLSQRYPPTLLQSRLFVSQRALWDQSFDKPVDNSLSAYYALPSLGLEIGAQLHQMNNFLYFDQRGFSAQTGSPLQVVQLTLREDLRLGPIHLDNTFAYQQPNRTDVLRLPKWFSKNSLYYSGKVFRKNLDLRAGFDFRMHAAFQPDAYQPVHWQFHLQDSIKQQPYPWLDAFIAFKIQGFRVFVRYENMISIWEPGKVWYQTAYYPQPFRGLRFGIKWRFLDANIQEAATQGTAPPAADGSNPPQPRRQ